MSDDLIDTVALALALRVSPSTIRTWANRGLIQRKGTDQKRRALYSLSEVRVVHSKCACRT